jgi:hypothetical protein
MTQPLAFTLRPAKSVVYVATIRPSEKPPAHHIESGDDVKLYLDRIEVFVRISAVLEASSFQGRVIGTNAHGATLPGGLEPGATVAFGEHQIFTCSKHR